MSDRRDETVMSLDIIGIQYATDKNSLVGDYLRHYDRIFNSLKQKEFDFIEIGVYRGASCKTWEKYFEKARIIGVDIDPECKKYGSSRVTIEIGSQNDPDFLCELTRKYDPLVIIDDGSHQSYDIIFTFERLFPALRPGGIYVVEDLHFHLMAHEMERLRGGSDVLAHDYILSLARDRLGGSTQISQLTGLRRYLLKQIDRVEFFGQAAVIFKKQEHANINSLLELLPAVEYASDWLVWLNYSQRVHEVGGDDQIVINALQRALSVNPQPLVLYHRLSEAQERARDLAGAIVTLEQASAQHKNDPEVVSDLTARITRLRSY